MPFKQQLINMHACHEAIDWIENRTIEQAWNDCHRGDWMLWLLEKMEEMEEEGWPDEKEIMLLECWCTRRVLKYISKEETRPLKAVEAKEAWARGKITIEKRFTAENAAFSAVSEATKTAANDKVKYLAYAATRAVAFSSAKHSASEAANVSANIIARGAVKLSNNTVQPVIFDEELLTQANYIRTQFTIPIKKTLESSNVCDIV